MDLATMLGIDESDPMQRRAIVQVREDAEMVDALVQRRRATSTQREIADAMGISQAAVARIEAANRDPRMSTIRRYAIAVGAVVRHAVTDVDDAGQWVSGMHEVRVQLANAQGVEDISVYSNLDPTHATVLNAIHHDAEQGSATAVRFNVSATGSRHTLNEYVGGSRAAC